MALRFVISVIIIKNCGKFLFSNSNSIPVHFLEYLRSIIGEQFLQLGLIKIIQYYRYQLLLQIQ